MAEPGLEPGPGAGPGPNAAEAVLRELALFELRCDGDDVAEKLLELSLTHRLGPVPLANELLAFVTSKDLDPRLTLDCLAAFEHEVLAKRGSRASRRSSSRHGGLRDVHSLQELLDEDEEEEEELLDAYTTPSKEPVTLLGQIACDSNGKLNAKSAVLEGDRQRSAGARVPLDLSELPEFSLFPGQIVALEGINSTGKMLVVSKLYEPQPLPFPSLPPPAAGPEQRAVLVACGPYATSDSVAFDPLSDLLDVIARDRPDVCVLFGPFVDAKHEQVENCQLPASFADVFKLCLKMILEGTRSAATHLVLVPSSRDVHHDCVYPQPPFPCPELPKEDRARVLFVSDPCTLDIDGVVFGLTSTDLLFHMGAEEISYYPLYPPSEELNVDYESFARFAWLPATPHVLVTPSELRYFVKDVLGCVCLNPGRLTKGRVGGTYGRLLLRPRDPERRHPCVSAQIIKI